MKPFGIFIVISFLSACAGNSGNSRPDYLDASIPPVGQHKVSQMEQNLTRSDQPIMAYRVDALFLSEPLLKARAQLLEEKTGKAPVRGNDRSKTCFEFTITSGAKSLFPGTDTASFANWSARVSNGTAQASIIFENLGPSAAKTFSGMDRAVMQGLVGTAAMYDQEQNVVGVSKGCANQSFDPNQPLSVSVVPTFGDERTKPAMFSWKAGKPASQETSKK